ncbi:unnamed protein product [Bursaphelenchus xylophilus]|uniref:(pine wood nematode) hypothetical protein n=1 Tax=Bursaphelenchus xylophilus TaxID=6326 RepID=A0A811M0N4_BURXY|nr:unnamed protein product [Bursaphelenchus xylophilus]CAG9125069.1 unnamed protein product [Bursaphelenchus xylophilus]
MELKMTNSQALCLVMASLIVLTSTALPLLEDRDMEKKSNLNEFMSAMKGAPRLRYGKRNFDEFVPAYQYVIPQRAVYKRMAAQNLPELIDTLNGAERLRFGRK